MTTSHAPTSRLAKCGANAIRTIEHMWIKAVPDLRAAPERRAPPPLRPAARLGRKVSDEFTVPLCRIHHRELHLHADEAGWWAELRLDPLATAQRLWSETRGRCNIAARRDS